MMRGERLYEQFGPCNCYEQDMKKLGEYLEVIIKREGTNRYYIGIAEDWTTQNLVKRIHLDGVLEWVHARALILVIIDNFVLCTLQEISRR